MTEKEADAWFGVTPEAVKAAKVLADGHQMEAQRAKNAAAVALGRLGGLKGGKAQAAKLSAAKRKASVWRGTISR